jgi:hypothetical protein
MQGVTHFTLSLGKANDKGEREGTLTLDPNAREFTEFGDVSGTATKLPLVALKCSLKLVKVGQINSGKPPFTPVDRFLYAIEGEKITSRLFLVTTAKQLNFGQLLVQNKEGKVVVVIHLNAPPPQPLPGCHPGCFPAGTPIHTPQGIKLIETVHAGDVITTVRPDGTTAPGQVQSVFVNLNHLLKVETEAGVLFTTQTQPLCLANGQLRAAGELKPGDKIYRWHNGQRQAVKVVAVTLTDRHEKVFNLVLGDSEVFIAGGFLARSKPPGDVTLSGPPTLQPSPALPPGKSGK